MTNVIIAAPASRLSDQQPTIGTILRVERCTDQEQAETFAREVRRLHDYWTACVPVD